MTVKQIKDFKNYGQALAWAVVEQGIYDYRSTVSYFTRETILLFFRGFIDDDILYNRIYHCLVQECDILG